MWGDRGANDARFLRDSVIFLGIAYSFIVSDACFLQSENRDLLLPFYSVRLLLDSDSLIGWLAFLCMKLKNSAFFCISS